MSDQDYAIVVGIDGYRHFDHLRAAQRDALDFAKWLSSGGKVPAANQKIILSSDLPANSIPAYPDKSVVERAFEDLVPDPTKRIGRRLYFYFAGHGCAPSVREVALLMANAARHLLGHSLGAHSYRTTLQELAPFDEIVFFLDCCRTLVERAKPSDLPMSGPPISSRAGAVKHLLCLGTGFGQEAYQLGLEPNEARGFFTEALIRGLNGAAANAEGKVTGTSLMDWIIPVVSDAALARRRRQRPEFDGNFNSIIFTTDVGENRIELYVRFPIDWTTDVMLSDGNLRQIEIILPGQEPRKIALKRGLYCVEHLSSGSKKFFSVETKNAGEVIDV